jgi:hypothetical protein
LLQLHFVHCKYHIWICAWTRAAAVESGQLNTLDMTRLYH